MNLKTLISNRIRKIKDKTLEGERITEKFDKSNDDIKAIKNEKRKLISLEIKQQKIEDEISQIDVLGNDHDKLNSEKHSLKLRSLNENITSLRDKIDELNDMKNAENSETEVLKFKIQRQLKDIKTKLKEINKDSLFAPYDKRSNFMIKTINQKNDQINQKVNNFLTHVDKERRLHIIKPSIQIEKSVAPLKRTKVKQIEKNNEFGVIGDVFKVLNLCCKMEHNKN